MCNKRVQHLSLGKPVLNAALPGAFLGLDGEWAQ